ncbi:hypothetical protein ACIQW9_01885 [Herminiimonas sp. NPDC097707]|uniref:hypothetical protein n=1 Tax=Herminiimonas sp. NPDC097707 TaxID=3364007 RepID=UPI00383A5510
MTRLFFAMNFLFSDWKLWPSFVTRPTVFFDTQLPGVARRLLTFLASPRKVSKRRRPHSRCPSGSRLCKAKNGKRTKLAFGSNNVHFFFHFLLCTNGSVTAGELQRQFNDNSIVAN